jgi:hypothetical protein
MFLGVGVLFGIMITSYQIAPDITRSLPYVGSILYCIYSNFQTIWH